MTVIARTHTSISPVPEVIRSLIDVLGHDFTGNLNSALRGLPPQSSLRLKIDAQIYITLPDSIALERISGVPIHLGSVDLEHSELQRYLQEQCIYPVAAEDSLPRPCDAPNIGSGRPSPCRQDSNSSHQNTRSSTLSPLADRIVAQNRPQNEDDHLDKRRKTFGGLHIRNSTSSAEVSDTTVALSPQNSTIRQLQTISRKFPQRKKKSDFDTHKLQPLSVDKFVTGIWKQIFSSIETTPTSLEHPYLSRPSSSDVDREAFRAINSLCLKVAKISKCSRSLETIIQAHWIDCFEARVKGIGIERPLLSTTETKMSAMREACTILQWSEKELRNKLAIWRGYKEIKDAGGWVSLVFAGSGVYRFCKYRTGFTKDLIARLGRLQSSFEVAADTIHPNWRKLLSIIGQESQTIYSGHPHDWVVCDTGKPVTLASTYTKWDPNFEFRHVEHSELDKEACGNNDPRCISSTSIGYCSDCGNFQSNNVSLNECRCFPELYGSCKMPCAVQVFRSGLGKNNGLLARCAFPRGSAIGEFVGLITKGMDGTDVMQSGAVDNPYQIYQGRMGNYTRFINHSCAPNSQFEKFSWLGSEHIILVSRGIEAGTEITVDYSHSYWEGLDKECLCGESCCRYVKGRSRT